MLRLFLCVCQLLESLQLSVLFRDTTSYLTLCPKNTTRGSRKSSFFSSLDSGGPPTLPSFDLSFFANPPPLSLMHRSALSSPSKTSSSSVFPLLFLHAHQNPFFSFFSAFRSTRTHRGSKNRKGGKLGAAWVGGGNKNKTCFRVS